MNILLQEEIFNFFNTGTCKGNCGDYFPCYCDSYCFYNNGNGCCSDFADVCPKPSQEYMDRMAKSGLVYVFGHKHLKNHEYIIRMYFTLIGLNFHITVVIYWKFCYQVSTNCLQMYMFFIFCECVCF